MLQVSLAATLLKELDLLPVPAGTATIGLEESLAAKFTKSYGESWREFYYRETPQHQVAVAEFALSRYPVTNGLFALFIEAGGYTNGDYWTPEGWAWRQRTNRTQPHLWHNLKFSGEDRPVVGVTWHEATAFVRWASAVTGHVLRLPTEVEWEWAARSANVRWLYPWGGVWNPDVLNSGAAGISGDIHGTTVPVGSYSPAGDGPYGHSDLLGQVWEWTSSAFAPYPYLGDAREDPYSPERRILKGGSWGDGKYANRVTTRYHYPEYYGDMTTGFRVAEDLSGRSHRARPEYDLVIYGRSVFCPDLVDVKAWLRPLDMPYRQLNIDLDEEAGFQLDDWLGMRVVPTLVVARRGERVPVMPPANADFRHLRAADRGTMLHEPDEETLKAFLERNGFLR